VAPARGPSLIILIMCCPLFPFPRPALACKRSHPSANQNQRKLSNNVTRFRYPRKLASLEYSPGMKISNGRRVRTRLSARARKFVSSTSDRERLLVAWTRWGCGEEEAKDGKLVGGCNARFGIQRQLHVAVAIRFEFKFDSVPSTRFGCGMLSAVGSRLSLWSPFPYALSGVESRASPLRTVL
jgi:hypothetical protein